MDGLNENNIFNDTFGRNALMESMKIKKNYFHNQIPRKCKYLMRYILQYWSLKSRAMHSKIISLPHDLPSFTGGGRTYAIGCMTWEGQCPKEYNRLW